MFEQFYLFGRLVVIFTWQMEFVQLTLSLPVPYRAGGSQYWRTFEQQYLENSRSKNCHYKNAFKEHLIRFFIVCRLIDFAVVVLTLLMFKVCRTTFPIFPVLKELNKMKKKKKKNYWKSPKLVSQSLSS